MAIGFGSGEGSGTTDKISYAQYAAINDLDTLTYAIWTYRVGVGGNNNGRMMEKDGAIRLFSNSTEEYNFAAVRWATTNGSWKVTGPSRNVWVNVLVTYDHGSVDNDPIFYFDGVDQGAPTESQTPVGTLNSETDPLDVGNRASSTRVWDGRLCEVAVWDRILNSAEAAAVGKKFSPLFFPDGLVLYDDLVRNVRNRLEGSTISTTGTAVVDHPPIIYPALPMSGFAAAAAAPTADELGAMSHAAMQGFGFSSIMPGVNR